MNCLNNIKKRPFAITTPAMLSFVIVHSILSFNIVYAYDGGTYQPSYTWSERPQRNVSHIAPITDHSLQNPVTFQAPDFSKYQNMTTRINAQQFNNYMDTMNRMESQHLRSLSNLSNITPITDHSLQTPVTYQAPDFSKYANPIQDPITFQTPDFSKYQNMTTRINAQQFNNHMDTMNRMESQHLRSLSNLSNITPPVSYQLQTPVTFQSPDFSQYTNNTWSDADRIRAIGKGYSNYIVNQSSQGVSGFFGSFDLGDRLGGVIERGLSGQITSEEMGRQYVLEMWRTFVPIVGEPAYQEYIHNPSAFEADIGRSFQQQQIYQPPIDLGTIGISPETIHVPTYEPIDMPIYEPIDIPMPIYQPPAIPNF